MNVIKIGSVVTDKITNLKGMVLHCQIASDESLFYNFQPRKINPETQLPVNSFWVTEDRIRTDDTEFKDYDIPLDAFGTIVEDTASGLKGKILYFIIHISGCVHATVQPTSVNKKTNELVNALDIDIRRLKGKALPDLTEKEIEQSQEDKPSPISVMRYTPKI